MQLKKSALLTLRKITMFQNKEGERVPNVVFKNRVSGEWVDTTTDDLFKGKTIAVFSLPGAFTPTCSTSHVPRYNELAETFKKHGVDDIVCLSVNDAFVMDEWHKSQEAENITFIPDGNGEFTDKMGLLVDKEDLGFGKRSWRYSMIVKDGVIEKMFIEPEKPGDPYEVSDADTMLDHIASDAEKPASIVMFSRKGCGHCARAKKLLDSKGMTFTEVLVGENVPARTLTALSGKTTTPQIFMSGEYIGGADELETYLK